mmetsp:Transcript_823/g.1597  ORF Transcript_823/g.1597 Transcript_823/m.1597 type:complete len:327 (-) Transcript_823:884-1864(-)
MENQSLLAGVNNPGNERRPKVVYRNRWWVCFVFSLTAVLQAGSWNFYGPINGDTLTEIYGWSTNFQSELPNSANFVFCTLVVPAAVWVDGKGVRVPFLVVCAAMLLCTGLRCLCPLVSEAAFEVISTASMLANGVAGTGTTFCPPVISAVWFPVQERNLATAIMATANYVGIGAGFLTGFAVPSLRNTTTDTTDTADISAAAVAAASGQDALRALNSTYYLCAGLMVVVTVAAVVNFPSRPPSAANVSSTTQKTGVKQGFVLLLRHGRFWFLCACMAVPLGVYSGWLLVLNDNLAAYHLSQAEASSLGVVCSVAGANSLFAQQQGF